MHTAVKSAKQAGTVQPPVWRVWIDTENRVVSFHEMEGCQMLEFRNQDLFFRCVEQYTTSQYRYQ